eukprot:6392039-Pyramimonas_sp.AAC.1
MKKQIRDHLIHGKYLAVYGTPKLQSYVQEVFSSHAVYRTKVEPLNDDMEVDLSWKMSAKDVEKKMFQLTGDCGIGIMCPASTQPTHPPPLSR